MNTPYITSLMVKDTGYAYACYMCDSRHGFSRYGVREIELRVCDSCQITPKKKKSKRRRPREIRSTINITVTRGAAK